MSFAHNLSFLLMKLKECLQCWVGVTLSLYSIHNGKRVNRCWLHCGNPFCTSLRTWSPDFLTKSERIVRIGWTKHDASVFFFIIVMFSIQQPVLMELVLVRWIKCVCVCMHVFVCVCVCVCVCERWICVCVSMYTYKLKETLFDVYIFVPHSLLPPTNCSL